MVAIGHVDGRTVVASGDTHGTVRLWHPTGPEVSTWTLPGAVHALGFDVPGLLTVGIGAGVIGIHPERV
ncbi:hypothetical protein Ait01nite_035480 [Actinoplanes italicus]|nr:hypothetical protein Ait01nite_035480 [Actinoplanes italicus]